MALRAGCLWILLAAGSAWAAAPELPEGVASLPFTVRSNRVFVEVTLNGATRCEALLDTGSEVTLANRTHVAIPDLRILGTQQLNGAFVGDLSAQRAILNSIKLGTYECRDVPLGVIKHGPGQSLEQIACLLGMDLLGRGRFTLEFAHGRLLFWPAGMRLPPPAPEIERAALPMHRAAHEQQQRPRAFGTINGTHRLSFLFDTGAETLLLAATKPHDELGLSAGGALRGFAQVNDGSTSRRVEIRETEFKAVAFGSLSFPRTAGRVLEAVEVRSPLAREDLAGLYNIAGLGFMKSLHAVHVDVPGRMLYLERRRTAP